MMGLGNGRRSMKSPPLILAALVACVIVLGFNYWIASSRSVELQTRIVELEGRVRRAAAERGAVELKKNEFQGELQKQKEQLDRIQSSHSFQLENVNRLHQDEKAVLVNNITTNEKLIQELQDQLKALQRSYGILQQDIFQFQKNQTSLEKKFSYDLSQCISQMNEVKEQCDERIEEVIRKRNEAPVSRDEAETNNQRQQALKPQPKLQEEVPLEEQMPQEKGDVSRNKSQIPAPNSGSSKPHVQNEETNEIQAVGEERSLRLTKASVQGQEAADGTRVGAEKLDQHTQAPAGLLARPEEDSQYPEREQLVIRDSQEQQHAAEEGGGQKNLGDEYDMDENEAESEREKQAALAGNDRNINVLNADAQKRGIINMHDGSERQNHILNQVGIHIPQQA
ncbi:Golgi membrane protein 1 [Mus pahari]|uniref:Golgi membrane protein 1 n=1 Tax=Mus pahari TaxID=10093 RepID=UPI000A312F56|nr:Golgi membrane protein 1 [Mus pahari]